jgi:hypothetical protein
MSPIISIRQFRDLPDYGFTRNDGGEWRDVNSATESKNRMAFNRKPPAGFETCGRLCWGRGFAYIYGAHERAITASLQ